MTPETRGRIKSSAPRPSDAGPVRSTDVTRTLAGGRRAAASAEEGRGGAEDEHSLDSLIVPEFDAGMFFLQMRAARVEISRGDGVAAAAQR